MILLVLNLEQNPLKINGQMNNVNKIWCYHHCLFMSATYRQVKRVLKFRILVHLQGSDTKPDLFVLNLDFKLVLLLKQQRKDKWWNKDALKVTCSCFLLKVMICCTAPMFRRGETNDVISECSIRPFMTSQSTDFQYCAFQRTHYKNMKQTADCQMHGVHQEGEDTYCK